MCDLEIFISAVWLHIRGSIFFSLMESLLTKRYYFYPSYLLIFLYFFKYLYSPLPSRIFRRILQLLNSFFHCISPAIMSFVSIIIFSIFAISLGGSCIILLAFFLIKILTRQWTSWCCWSLPPKLTLGKLKTRKEAWVWKSNVKLRPPEKMRRLLWAGVWARGHTGMDVHTLGQRGVSQGRPCELQPCSPHPDRGYRQPHHHSSCGEQFLSLGMAAKVWGGLIWRQCKKKKETYTQPNSPYS